MDTNNNNNNNNNKENKKQSLIIMIELTKAIYKHYMSTQPYEDILKEKEKLKKYIIECGKYLQGKCEQDLKKYNHQHRHRHNKRHHHHNNNNNDNDIDYGKYEFLEAMNRSEHYNRRWDIFTFGSESWNTSCRDSDIDMAIFVNFRNTRPDKKYLLHELAKIIGENDNDGVLFIKELLNAKYPIIRINHIKFTNIKIDVSIADRYCKNRDKYISQILTDFEKNYNIPVKPFIVFIKYWSKQKGINNAYHCYLNSFGYTLFVIKFLQWFCDHNQFSRNFDPKITYSLSNLAYRFFKFYAEKWIPQQHAISITHHQHRRHRDYYHYDEPIFNAKTFYQDINGYAFMEVNDPINAENNVSAKIGEFQCQQIKQEFIKAYELIKRYKNGNINNNEKQSNLFQLLTQKPFYLQQHNHVIYPPYYYVMQQNIEQQQQQQKINMKQETEDIIQPNQWSQQHDDLLKDQQFQNQLYEQYEDGDTSTNTENKKEKKEKDDDSKDEEEEDDVANNDDDDDENETESQETCEDDVICEEETCENDDILLSTDPVTTRDNGHDLNHLAVARSVSVSSGSNDIGNIKNNEIDDEHQEIESNEDIQDSKIDEIVDEISDELTNVSLDTHSFYDDLDDLKTAASYNDNNNQYYNQQYYNNTNSNNINNNGVINNNNNNNNSYNYNHYSNYMKMDNIPYPYHKSPFRGNNNSNSNNNGGNYRTQKRRDNHNQSERRYHYNSNSNYYRSHHHSRRRPRRSYDRV